jgi:hypothetical protein
MANCTPGLWTKTSSGTNNVNVWECDVVGSTSNDYYTKVIDFVDPTKPWYVFVNTGKANTAGVTPVDLWGGWTNIGMTGDGGTVDWATAGKGFEVHGAMIDDVQSLAKSINLNPAYAGTAVAGAAGVMGHRCPPTLPFYAINCDAGAAASVTVHFVVVQQ